MILRLFVCLQLLILFTLAIDPEIIHIRAKRQPCRCVRDVSLQNSLTCGCAAPLLIPGGNYAFAQYQQQLALASQLQYVQPVYTSCGCVPLMYMANPVYSCQCNGETPTTPPSPPVVTSTTSPGTTTSPITTIATTITVPIVPTTSTTTTATTPTPTTSTTTTPLPTTTTSTTTTTTTTTPATTTTTTTTTPAPQTTTTTIAAIPETTTTPGSVPPTTSAPCIYPPVATVNSTSQGCFCLDVSTQVVQPLCGCQCNCQTALTSVPNGVCSCPQQSHPTPAPVSVQPIVQSPPMTSDSMYPLTTTCVIQIGIPHVSTQSCSCLPQYSNCAPNICCLKPAFRSYKKTPVVQDERSAIDMIIDLLKTMRADV